MVITNGIQMTDLQLKHWLVELDPSKMPNFFKNAAPRLLNRCCRSQRNTRRWAFAVARRQEARLWELRAACSLGRLWREQGRHGDARARVVSGSS